MTIQFKWVNDESRKFMERGYLQNGQTIEDRVSDIAKAFQTNLIKMGLNTTYASEKANAFYYYMSQGYYSLASPVWSNYGTDRGLPVSCFGSVVGDDMSQIMYTAAETGMLMKNGGGTSGYFGNLRPRGAEIKGNGESSGSVHFMKLFDSMTDVVSQGSVRRGFFTPYLPADHEDIMEFLEIGMEGNPIQGMTTGVCLSHEFMQRVKNMDKESVTVWLKILEARSMLGYPYLLFTGNANDFKPEIYKELNMDIVASNMCSEIMLPSSEDETFVCVLSSMNLEKYHEWKGTEAVTLLTYFLDTVVEEFITKLKVMEQEEHHFFLSRVLKFAEKHRALGLGVLGWHSLLQKESISFESKEAAELNLEIFKAISKEANEASQRLSRWFGEPALLKGKGRRNTTLMAVAPTKSSSFILGQVSQGIEPEKANAYIKNTAKVKTTYKNPYLRKVLQKYSKDVQETWMDIIQNGGSVQHLDFLSDHEKEVFRTFAEIDPKAVLDQQGIRGQFVDQGVSLNVTIDPNMPVKEVHKLMLYAYDLGIKSIYYQHSVNAAQMLGREKASCPSCES
jgi:ribonucleoside-diphosphate reductase alpha chain